MTRQKEPPTLSAFPLKAFSSQSDWRKAGSVARCGGEISSGGSLSKGLDGDWCSQVFSFQCPAIAFIPKHLCWARQRKDALFVKYKERHCGFRAEGSHRGCTAGGKCSWDSTLVPSVSAGWTPPTKLPCPRQGYHAEIISESQRLPSSPGFLERAKEHNGEFYTSPPPPTPLPCPSARLPVPTGKGRIKHRH